VARLGAERLWNLLHTEKFVGAGYFDLVQTTVIGGEVSTSALKGSTEEEQFHGTRE